ncbi:2'-5' RNA ligase family protein [Bacillus sp. FJAT-27916]|uniref:2'-5' RNA ligase family protein n=1 Tax=Bacillus sp. FJAT-27916 TaxID=1679169 RepID=UPI000A5DE23D|nr:2'-5' RNA ligase family protein [Bacillus sp. FJAT-27916]
MVAGMEYFIGKCCRIRIGSGLSDSEPVDREVRGGAPYFRKGARRPNGRLSLARTVRKVCQRFKPFHVSLDGPAYFGETVLYLGVQSE